MRVHADCEMTYTRGAAAKIAQRDVADLSS
jgi:hypothetical protein